MYWQAMNSMSAVLRDKGIPLKFVHKWSCEVPVRALTVVSGIARVAWWYIRYFLQVPT
jgi:hypothetical protein